LRTFRYQVETSKIGTYILPRATITNYVDVIDTPYEVTGNDGTLVDIGPDVKLLVGGPIPLPPPAVRLQFPTPPLVLVPGKTETVNLGIVNDDYEPHVLILNAIHPEDLSESDIKIGFPNRIEVPGKRDSTGRITTSFTVQTDPSMKTRIGGETIRFEIEWSEVPYGKMAPYYLDVRLSSVSISRTPLPDIVPIQTELAVSVIIENFGDKPIKASFSEHIGAGFSLSAPTGNFGPIPEEELRLGENLIIWNPEVLPGSPSAMSYKIIAKKTGRFGIQGNASYVRDGENIIINVANLDIEVTE
jgi:hypothetical protein